MVGLPGELRGGGGLGQSSPKYAQAAVPPIRPHPVHLEADPVGGGNPERPPLDRVLDPGLKSPHLIPFQITENVIRRSAPRGESANGVQSHWRGRRTSQEAD